MVVAKQGVKFESWNVGVMAIPSNLLLGLFTAVKRANCVCAMAEFLVGHIQKLNIRWRIAIGAVVVLFILLLTPSGLDIGSDANYPSESKSSSLLGRLKDISATSDQQSSLAHSSSANIWPGSKPDDVEHVAICLAVKDQASDLKEWFTHHYHHLGIRRFYVMDDRSSPALDNYEDYPIPRSAITFRYFTPETRTVSMQYHLYDECHARFGMRHHWIGFLDADEFLEIVDKPGTSMADFLRDYEDFGALGVQWIIHDSNGLLEKPAVGVREAYTSCITDGQEGAAASDNKHIKSFVQTKYYVKTESPHNFFLNSSMYTVGENKDRVTYAFREPITRQKVALHHYFCKSKAEYELKMARGNGADTPKEWDTWNKFELAPKQNCASLAIYRP